MRKVYGGTSIGKESRCDTCSFARIIQGHSETEKVVICAAVDPAIKVPFKVAECSSYEDKRLPDLREMKQISWQIRTKSAGRTAGFILGAPLKKERESEQAGQEVVPAASSKDE